MNVGTLALLSGLLLPAGGWPLPFLAHERPTAEHRRRVLVSPRSYRRAPTVPGLRDCIALDLRQVRHPCRRALHWSDRRSRAERRGR